MMPNEIDFKFKFTPDLNEEKYVPRKPITRQEIRSRIGMSGSNRQKTDRSPRLFEKKIKPPKKLISIEAKTRTYNNSRIQSPLVLSPKTPAEMIKEAGRELS